MTPEVIRIFKEDAQAKARDILDCKAPAETCDLEVIDDIAAAAAEIFAERLADFRVLAQDEQAVFLFVTDGFGIEAEFLVRAKHPVRFHAANFPDLDGEWHFVARLHWQRRAGQDERHFVARLEILRAADDLAFARAIVDAADG